jgi:hypothetical protein
VTTDRWQFIEDGAGRWLWRHTAPDGTVRAGVHPYSSRTDCIVDAMRHGYLALDEARDNQTRSEPGLPSPADRSSEAGDRP